MAIATAELDPQFVKALHLLFSKAKDATEQLKQMLDDVLNLRHQADGREMVQKESDTKPIGGKLSLLKSESHSKHSGEVKKREAEKRTLEKVKTEVDTFPESSKKAKYDTHRSTGSGSTHSLSIKDEPEEVDNDDQVTDADDFAMEMGLACVVCRQLDVQPGNQLVECQECHNLYHQECHRPPTTDQDVNDPRLVWYCTRCTKTFKKLASKTQKNKSSAPPPTKEIAPSKSVKQEAPTLQPFKRAEPKTTLSSSSSSTSSQPLTGLASLAANLSGKVSSLSTKSSGSSKTSSIKSSSMTSSSTGKASSQLNLITSSSSSFSKAQTSGPATLQKYGALLSSLTNTTVSGKPSSGYNSNSGNGSSGNSNSSSSSSSSSGSSSKANVSSSTSSSKQNTSNSNSSSSSMMSADKRLQMMKKKAAAKMQEKRRLSK